MINNNNNNYKNDNDNNNNDDDDDDGDGDDDDDNNNEGDADADDVDKTSAIYFYRQLTPYELTKTTIIAEVPCQPIVRTQNNVKVCTATES